jgi:acyl carrier protein
LVSIEEEFGLILDDSTLTVAAFESIGTLAHYVEGQLSGQTTP